MKLKRVFAAVTAFAMCAALAGCGAEAAVSKSAAESAVESAVEAAPETEETADAAATEAALRGLPAVAFSRPRPELEPPQALARHAASLVDAVDWRCCAGKVLNVNYPRCRVAEIKGIRAARMAESRWAENYERREDPAGRPYWWIADFLKRDSGGDDTDIALMEGNWVAVTPLQVDRTDRELLGRLQERFGV